MQTSTSAPTRISQEAATLINNVAKREGVKDVDELMLLVCDELEALYGDEMPQKANQMGIGTSVKLKQAIESYLIAPPPSAVTLEGFDIQPKTLRLIDTVSRRENVTDPEKLVALICEEMEKEFGADMNKNAAALGLGSSADLKRCVDIYLITRKDFPTYRIVRPLKKGERS